MRKHGISNFDVREIGRAKDKQLLDNLERVYIILFGSMNRDLGYNRRAGGESGSFSDETKAKMSAARKGWKPSPESIAKRIVTITGRPLSDQHKKKLSEILTVRNAGVNLGIKRSEETKAKMRKPKAPEHKAKIVAHLESARKVWQAGDARDSKGRFVKGVRKIEMDETRL